MTAYRFLDPPCREILLRSQSKLSRTLGLQSPSKSEHIRFVRFVVMPNGGGDVRIGEDGRSRIWFGLAPRDLEELALAVLNLLRRNRARRDELGARMFVEHLLNKGLERLARVSSIDELLSAH